MTSWGRVVRLLNHLPAPNFIISSLLNRIATKRHENSREQRVALVRLIFVFLCASLWPFCFAVLRDFILSWLLGWDCHKEARKFTRTKRCLSPPNFCVPLCL